MVRLKSETNYKNMILKEKKDGLDAAMISDIEKMTIIDNFLNMLHKGEYIIDPNAKDIPYGDKSSLADFIDQALQG
jgi:hypothetical protein